MYDALVISDLHLGSDVCRAKLLARFLESIHQNELSTARLILNGDVFDSFDFRRLKRHHWKVLSLIRKLSDSVEIIWVNGNHDGPTEFVSHLLGVTVQDEIILDSGDRRILMLHGHRFDEFIERYPITSKIADLAYRGLQWLDKSHTVARYAKSSSKTFLRCVEKIKHASRNYAVSRGCDVVCCGHTHAAAAVTDDEAADYFNSGCWTESPAHYLAIRAGSVELCPVYDDVVESLGEGSNGIAGRVVSMNSQTITPSA